jgi:hypothetical protein
MMAAIVVPCGRLNIAITLACLESARVRGGSVFPLFRRLTGALAGLRRFADGAGGFFWFRWTRRFVLDPDGPKALLRDPQGTQPLLVAAPDRQGANDLASGAAGQIGWPLKGTVVALRCRRQQHQLGIGQFHGILHSVDDGERRHHRSPAVAARPAGQESEKLIAARNGHSTARFAPECQSFLDNLPTGFEPKGSANNTGQAKATCHFGG